MLQAEKSFYLKIEREIKMKMQIEFYSKAEMAIQIDFSGRYPFAETETSELFLFACYTLRQLRNLGQHPAPKILTGLLVSKKYVSSLLTDVVNLPSTREILSGLNIYITSIVARSHEALDTIKISEALYNQFRLNETVKQVLDTEFLAKIPRFVDYNSKGKKSFLVTLPPFQLNHKGFGIFGWSPS